MSLSTGTRLGPYEILAVVGAGGMGEVYKAHDARLDRAVAIKVLPESFASDADRLRRFEIEAKAAGALNHPNILVVHDIGMEGGAPYLVSELLEGESLRERLKRGKLSPGRAIEMARQIVAGLAAAHAKGIVHRDLKPDNIFVTRDGRVKILDFGLAKVTTPIKAGEGATRTLDTGPGTAMGTVAYMSPEQVRGKTVDHRSDIFSFGCVLFEMVTGERAFQGETSADTMSAILHADPVDELPAAAAIPAVLSRTIRHCLEKDVDERFQSAKDLAFDLEAASSISGTTSVAARPAPARRRSRIPVWALALCAAAAGAAMWWGMTRRSAEPPTFQRLTFQRGIIQNARFTPDGSSVIYGASWDGEPISLYSMQPGQTEALALGARSTGLFAVSASGEIAAAVGCRFQGTFRVEGTLAQMPLNGSAPRELLENVVFADWSPDGSQLAVVVWDGTTPRLEFPPGQVVYRSTGTAWPGDIRISPQGDKIAFADHYYYGDDGSVAVLDRAGRKTTISERFTSLQGLAWSPSGKEVWYSGAKSGGERALYASNLGGQQRLILRLPGTFTFRDIAKDGRVLVSRDEPRLEVQFVGPGDDRPRDLSWLDWTELCVLSDDGHTLALVESGDAVAGEHVIYVRKTDGSPAVRIGKGRAAALSPDGKWVLSVDDQNPGASAFMLLPLRAGTPIRVETGLAISATTAAWLPDGKGIVYVANESGRPRRTYVQELDGAARPATPEGSLLVALRPDGSRLLARNSEGYALYPVNGGQPQPVRWLTADDRVLGFASGGDAVYLTAQENDSRIYRVDLTSGKREMWKELRPADPAGSRGVGWIRITPDGRSIAYSGVRTDSELYLVTGLK
jgi:eukaryotic-like serine/threonine-protein kinase